MRTQHFWTLALLGAAAAASSLALDSDMAPFWQSLATKQRRSPGVKKSRLHKTIYKGKTARAREYPFQVYLRVFEEDGNIEYCGASIIGTRHILTAAHCVKDKVVKKVCAIMGTEDRFASLARKFTVVRKHFYPKKDNENVTADIAILMVDRPIPLGKPNIEQIRLVGKEEIKPNTMCSISGWGQTDNVMDDRDLLREAKVPLVSKELCRSAYPLSPPDDLLCAGFYDRGGEDTCKGDSGGPLVCNNLLTGIVKSGKGCGLPKYPGTYTDVRYYWSWVKAVITADSRKLAEGGKSVKYANLC